jgi:hypothetical protein
MKQPPYSYFFPHWFGKQHKFDKHSKDVQGFFEYSPGQGYRPYHEEFKGFVRYRYDGMSLEEQLKREWVYDEFVAWEEWVHGGRNIVSFTPELLDLLAYTDVDDVALNRLQAPYPSFYLSLRSLNIPFIEGASDIVDGVYIEQFAMREISAKAGDEKGLRIILAGNYEPLQQRYGHQLGFLYQKSIRHYSLLPYNQQGLDHTVGSTIAYQKEHFAQDVEHVGILQGEALIGIYNSLVERTLSAVINCLLYLNWPERDVRQAYPSDLPIHLMNRLKSATTRHRKEIAQKQIDDAGYTRINYVGERFSGQQTPSSRPEENLSVKVAPHWRRGHWRNQRFGVGLQEVRYIWIKPTIVNKEVGLPPKGHIYTVDK